MMKKWLLLFILILPSGLYAAKNTDNAHFNMLWGVKNGHADYKDDIHNLKNQSAIGAEVDFKLFKIPLHLLISYSNHQVEDRFSGLIYPTSTNDPSQIYPGRPFESTAKIDINEYKIGIKKYIRKEKVSLTLATGYVQIKGTEEYESTFFGESFLDKNDISAHGYFIQTAITYDLTERLYAGAHIGFSSAIDKGAYINLERGGILTTFLFGFRI